MINSIKRFLKTGRIDDADSSNEVARHAHKEIELAVAVLLIEAAHLEENYSSAEQETIEAILKSKFDLAEEERSDLMEIAQKKQSEAVELHSFTNTIKETYSPEERVEIIEMLWEVAYADGKIHDYEAYLLRKIAGLIHVSDRDRGDAQKKVRAKLGLPNST